MKIKQIEEAWFGLKQSPEEKMIQAGQRQFQDYVNNAASLWFKGTQTGQYTNDSAGLKVFQQKYFPGSKLVPPKRITQNSDAVGFLAKLTKEKNAMASQAVATPAPAPVTTMSLQDIIKAIRAMTPEEAEGLLDELKADGFSV